jgi:PadR family transcriptional regulator, regulatory protein AphA
MVIKFAILGYLSWQPSSGYDLKKLFEDSAVFHWSGNNNQIYKTLVELHNASLVTLHIEQQADYPPRKIYTITAKGVAALKQWVLTPPELPQIKNVFLVQLAWADQLDTAELDALMQQYEAEVHIQVLMLHEHKKRQTHSPQRTARERYLWDEIMNNRIAFYDNELNWIRNLRQTLINLPDKEA